MNLKLYVIYFTSFIPLNGAKLISQDISHRFFQSSPIAMDNVEYIYNKAFDIALRDNRSELEHRSIFHMPTKDFESIVITIDTLLKRGALSINNIDELSEVQLSDSIGVSKYYDLLKIRNTFEVKYKHYTKTPVLNENHLLHVTFSDLYIHQQYLYLGVLLEYNTGEGVNYPEWVIFQIQLCNNKYVMFRKLFIPFGTDGYKNYYYSKDLEEFKCY